MKKLFDRPAFYGGAFIACFAAVGIGLVKFAEYEQRAAAERRMDAAIAATLRPKLCEDMAAQVGLLLGNEYGGNRDEKAMRAHLDEGIRLEAVTPDEAKLTMILYPHRQVWESISNERERNALMRKAIIGACVTMH